MAFRHLVSGATVLAGLWLGLAVVPAAGQGYTIGLATALKQRLDLFAVGAHNDASTVEPRLAPEQKAALHDLGVLYARSGDEAALVAGWERYIAANRPDPADVDPLISLILRECFRQGSADVKAYAQRLLTPDTTRAEAPSASPPKHGTAIVFLGRTSLLRLPVPVEEREAEIDIGPNNPLARQQRTIDSFSMVTKRLHGAAMATLHRG